jgi:hypothetical protein
MRFEQLSTLALAVTAAATPLADKIYQLNDIINGLEQSLANWQGSYVGMITILMPSLTANVQALLLTSDITNTAKAAGALSEEDADNVLAALEESNNGRPTVEQTVIQKQDTFVALDKGWADVILVYAGVIGHLATEAQTAIKNALPADKQAQAQEIIDAGQNSLDQIRSTYAR